jgi:hypothetical protein
VTPDLGDARRRVVGIHSGALGDVVMFAQLLATLGRQGWRTCLAAGGQKGRLLQSLGAVDESQDFESLPLAEVFGNGPTSQATLSRYVGRCDWLISCFAHDDLHAQSRLGELCAAGRASFLPIRPPGQWGGHLVELWAERIGLAGVDVPAWSVGSESRESARSELASLGVDAARPFVAMHFGSGGVSKCWPVDSFIGLAGLLDMPAVLLAGPVEVERLGRAELDGIAGRATLLVCDSLALLAGVLGLAHAFIGNDSGPAHLAAAIGTPTLGLFGPSDPAHFAPRGRAARTIRRQPLAALGPGEVAQALSELLGDGAAREAGTG